MRAYDPQYGLFVATALVVLICSYSLGIILFH